MDLKFHYTTATDLSFLQVQLMHLPLWYLLQILSSQLVQAFKVFKVRLVLKVYKVNTDLGLQSSVQ